MLRELRIGDMVAKLPIIQGGMGVGVSLSRLAGAVAKEGGCLLYTSPSPRDRTRSRMPSSA